MCLENFRAPTEEERSRIHIGYKIVKKIPGESGRFIPVYQGCGTVYIIGETEESNRHTVISDPTKIHSNELDDCQIHYGIHFYIDPEIEKYPFKEEEDYSLIKIEIQGQDLVAFGEGPYPYPCPYPCPNPNPYPCPCPSRCPSRCPYPHRYRCQAVATKIKVLEEVKHV